MQMPKCPGKRRDGRVTIDLLPLRRTRCRPVNQGSILPAKLRKTYVCWNRIVTFDMLKRGYHSPDHSLIISRIHLQRKWRFDVYPVCEQDWEGRLTDTRSCVP